MARKDITMSPDEIRAFLKQGDTIQVATVGIDGYPHLAPMWYVVDDGKVVFRSFTKSQKIVNMLRNPKVTVLLEEGKTYAELRGVMIRGTARLVTDRDYVLSIYARLAVTHPIGTEKPVPIDADSIEAVFGRYADKNTVVVVEPDKIASWDHRKLGGSY